MIQSPFIAVVQSRNFRNLLLAQITSQVSLNMLSFILAIRVYQETQSNMAVSLLLLTFGIPSLIFGIVAGGIVDNFDKRDVLVSCNFIRVLTYLLFFVFAKNLLILYILAVIFSIVTQFFIPAEAPSIPSMVSSQLLLTANSLFAVSYYLSTIVGFVAAGPMLRWFGNTNVYLVMTVLMLFASILVLYLPKLGRRRKEPLSFSIVGHTIEEGLQFIRCNSRVRQSLILMTFAQALVITLSVLSPGFADKVLAIDLTEASYLVMGPAAIGLVFGALLIGSYGNKFLKGTIILTGIIATGVILLMLSFLSRGGGTDFLLSLDSIRFVVGNLWFAMLCLFLLGFFNSFISVPASTILQQDSQGELRGRVYGVFTSMVGGISVLPVIFSGILADYAGVGKTLAYIGIIVIILGLYHYYWRHKSAIPT